MAVAGLVASMSAFANPEAVRYYEDALDRFNSGDSRGALIQLKNALKHDPSQLAAQVLIGQVYLELSSYREAEKALALAETLGVDRSLIAVPLARARNAQHKYEDVVEMLRPSEYPSAIQADLWAELGKARLGLDDQVGAQIAFEEALKLVPGHVEVRLAQVAELTARGQFSEAEPIVTEILSRHPENPDGWFFAGSIRHATGQYDGALVHYAKSLELDAEHQRSALGQALALLDAGNTAEAAQKLQALRGANPNSLQVLYFLSRALRQLGRAAEADAVFEAASDLVNRVSPQDIAWQSGQLILAANIKLQNAEFEAAHAFLSRYVDAKPEDVSAKKLLARVLVKLNKASDAQRLLTRLRVGSPDDAELLVMLGDVNSTLHDYAAAERYYRFALQQVQNNNGVLVRIGISQLQQGQKTAAIDSFRQLAADPAGNPNAGVFLAILYFNEGRLKEAGQVVGSILDQQPDNLVAMNLNAAVVMGQGDLTTGRSLLEETLQKDPGFLPAEINLIRLDILEGKLESAEQSLDRLLAALPTDTFVLREAARLAMARNQPEEAIAFFERIREHNRHAARPLVDLVRLYLAEGRTTDALTTARGLLQAVPNNIAALKVLAEVQLAVGDNAQALSTLNDASRQAASDPKQLVAVARLQAQAGAFREAEQLVLRAIEADPGTPAWQLELADLKAQQQKFAQAVEGIERVLEAEPDNVRALAMLGDVRSAQGSHPAAVRLYRQALSLANRADLVVSLHRALVRSGKTVEALQLVQEWHLANPQTPAVMRVLADHLDQIGEKSAALHLYHQLVDTEPDNAEFHNNLANLLLPVDAELALQSAIQAYELAPENAAVLDTLGWMLVQLGDLEGGLAHLRNAIVRNSRIPTIRYHLGVALQEYGNVDAAKNEFRRALKMQGPFPERNEARRRLQLLESRG